MAICMVLWRRSWHKHWTQFKVIFWEIMTIRDPNKLSAIAAERKSTMFLLPYGIPITLGTILYFAWTGMLI
jgi:prepilin peptidase CpaA